MGVGPASGSFLGGYFRDMTGSYRASILFALGSFVFSALAASSLPLSAKPRHLAAQQPEPELALAGRSH
jgi:hypothetical protein